MKAITFPEPIQIGTVIHNAEELLEDLVMVRQAWRIGEGPKHAAIVFSAFDKLKESASSGILLLPDKTYDFLLEQATLDPNSNISPRAANRFYLRIIRALNDAKEHEEKT